MSIVSLMRASLQSVTCSDFVIHCVFGLLSYCVIILGMDSLERSAMLVGWGEWVHLRIQKRDIWGWRVVHAMQCCVTKQFMWGRTIHGGGEEKIQGHCSTKADAFKGDICFKTWSRPFVLFLCWIQRPQHYLTFSVLSCKFSSTSFLMQWRMQLQNEWFLQNEIFLNEVPII